MNAAYLVGVLAPKRPLRVVAGFHTGDRLRCVKRVGMETDAHLTGKSLQC